MNWWVYAGLVFGIPIGFILLVFLTGTIRTKLSAQTLMDEARDATFSVIEVSLQDMPEVWKLVPDKPKDPTYLSNIVAGVAIYIGRGSTGLYVVNKDKSFAQIIPTFEWQVKLWKAAKAIVTERLEADEAKELKRMVDGFANVQKIQWPRD